MKVVLVICAMLSGALAVIASIETARASGNAESCQQSYNRNLPRCRGR